MIYFFLQLHAFAHFEKYHVLWLVPSKPTIKVVVTPGASHLTWTGVVSTIPLTNAVLSLKETQHGPNSFRELEFDPSVETKKLIPKTLYGRQYAVKLSLKNDMGRGDFSDPKVFSPFTGAFFLR